MARLFVSASSQRLSRATAPLTGYPLTMAAWVKPTTVTATQTALSLCSTGANVNYHALAITSAAKILYETEQAGVAADAIGTTNITAGAWHHLCAVGTSATARATFRDGVADGTNVTSSTPASIAGVEIGDLITSTTHASFFNGSIAEAAIWNVALTQNEITMLSKGVSPLMIRPSALVFYVPVGGGSSPEPDFKNATGMTLSGTPAISEHPSILQPAQAIIIPKTPTGGATNWTKNLSDTVTLSDAAFKSMIAAKADTITLSDAAAKTIILTKGDSIAVSDAATKSVVVSKADTITLSDVLSRTVAFSRPLADTVTLSDVVAKAVGLAKADTITLSDVLNSISGHGYTLSLADTITLSDVVAKAATISKSDTITLSDAIIKAFGARKSDTVTLSDAVAKTVGLSKSDTVTLTDAIAKAMAHRLADTITLGDVISPVLTPGGGPGTAWTLNLADTITMADALHRTLTDAGATPPTARRARSVFLNRFGIY